MFRIQNTKSNPTLYSRSNGRARFNMLLKHKTVSSVLLILVLLVAAYGVWTHGTFTLEGSKTARLEAQARSPLPPEWLDRYFGVDLCTRNNHCGVEADPDSDGLNNYEEFLFFTDPNNTDTDGDGDPDGVEVKQKFTNPIGAGGLTPPRDITRLSDYSPFADQLVQEGLEEVRKGNILTIEQIKDAAAKLSTLPQFYEVPFNVIQNNSQEAINLYLSRVSEATDQYRQKSSVSPGPYIIDSTDLGLVNDYIEATQVYAATLVAIEVPSDIFSFHKALLGSVVFQGLMAGTQKSFLEGQFSEDEARERIQDFMIYYTRFAQEMEKEAILIKQKYEFPFQTPSTTN